MSFFRTWNDGRDVARYRCTAVDGDDLVCGSHTRLVRDEDEIVTLLSCDPDPLPQNNPWTVRTLSSTLMIGDWFDFMSPWGWCSRRVIARHGDGELVCRGLSAVNPNFDTVATISMHEDFGHVFRMPAPVMLDAERRTVRLASAQWTLLQDEDWAALKEVVDWKLINEGRRS